VKEQAMHEDAPFGLLGRTLGHSWSPQIHTMLGSAPYALHELEPAEVAPFIRTGAWQGLNVTIPYKRNAFELADEASPRAKRLGVANTLIHRPDGRIYADNTDLAGFSWMLERFCQQKFNKTAQEALTDEPVLVLGSGGASQAVQAALADTGARTAVISRHGADNYATVATRHSDAILVVNATPVGMFPHCPASPLSSHAFEALESLRGALDVIYNPQRTGLCLEAEKRGLPYESGLTMLVAQARFSSELFQGKHLDDAEVCRIEKRLEAQSSNICLIGMPGVGKTSTGTALAHQLRRPFVDLDEAFRLEQGQMTADYIEQNGEAAFRILESKLLARYGASSGLVIACGGGVVMRPENYWLLHQNGYIIMLDRPIEDLPTRGRPLSRSIGVEKLAEARMELYRKWSDIRIGCTGTPAGDAQAICNALGWDGDTAD
jgi:shikimate dehydrogenase